jgi:membrane protease YdiL (CAAX protease family)
LSTAAERAAPSVAGIERVSSAATARSAAMRAFLLLAGLGVALLVRVLTAELSGSPVATSRPAGALFAVLITGVAAAPKLLGRASAAIPWPPSVPQHPATPLSTGRLRTGRLKTGRLRTGRLRTLAVWSVVGSGVLVAGPVIARLAHADLRTQALAALGFNGFWSWAALVGVIATAEELLVRGTLYRACEEAFGTLAAIVVSALTFALIHIPLYGLGALPVDLAVGLWLSGLRAASGSVLPAIAGHAIADWAAWWLT